MRGLCGWFAGVPVPAPEALLEGMLAATRPAARDAARREAPGCGLAAWGGAPQALVEIEGYTLAVGGHPRLTRGGGRDGDLRRIAQVLRDDGAAALPELGGDFALAGWHHASGRGLLAVDRLGAQRLVYVRHGGVLGFGSNLDALGGLPGVQRRLSPQALYDYLYYHVIPGPQTIHEGMLTLPPGHCIEFGPGHDAQARPWWRMRFTETLDRPVEELQETFLQLLRDSVGEASDAPDVGAFLSGGTDSSTVCGTLRQVRGSARTFSIGFDVEGYDETGYARIAASHFGTEHHEYYVTPQDVVESVPRIAAAYDQPFGNASAIPTYHCGRVAHEHGVRRMLAGDGGDELFGGNDRYGKQWLLSLYHHLPAGLRRGVIEPLLERTPGVQAVMPLRKLRSYVEQARPEMPLRYESYNLLQHLGPQAVLQAGFLAQVDTGHPRALLREAHAPFSGDSLVNQMLGIDLRFTLADGDLPKVTHMCNLAGVDVAYPLLDDRLVDFSRQLPSHLKLRRTQLRWFFKHALRDFLPPQIITKQKHGFGLPVGHWLMTHAPLRDLAMDGIGKLKPHGLVDERFVDELMRRRLPEHPGYYGTMVWLLMMLGLWMESRGH